MDGRFAPAAWALVSFLLGAANPARAFDVLSIEVTHAADVFHVRLEARLDAPVNAVEAVLRDYDRYPGLDPRIEEARVLERLAPDRVLLFTRLRACAGIFCRTIERVEEVEERRRELLAYAIPERSDLRAGSTHTVLTGRRGQTLVRYRSTFVPDFWVPDLIANGLAVRALEDATLALFRNVERRATDLQAR